MFLSQKHTNTWDDVNFTTLAGVINIFPLKT